MSRPSERLPDVGHPRPSPGPRLGATEATPSSGGATARSTRMLSLATATRDYARFVEAGTFDRLPSSNLRCLFEAMGPDLWAWQYALRLTQQTAWRCRPEIDEEIERSLAMRAMSNGIETWVRALAALDTRIEQARIHGQPMPQALAVPADVLAALEARKAAALERIARRRGRAGEGDTDPAAIPDAVKHQPPLPGRPA